MGIPAGNCSVDKRSIRSPTKRIRMGKASSFDKPTFLLHKAHIVFILTVESIIP